VFSAVISISETAVQHSERGFSERYRERCSETRAFSEFVGGRIKRFDLRIIKRDSGSPSE